MTIKESRSVLPDGILLYLMKLVSQISARASASVSYIDDIELMPIE